MARPLGLVESLRRAGDRRVLVLGCGALHRHDRRARAPSDLPGCSRVDLGLGQSARGHRPGARRSGGATGARGECVSDSEFRGTRSRPGAVCLERGTPCHLSTAGSHRIPRATDGGSPHDARGPGDDRSRAATATRGADRREGAGSSDGDRRAIGRGDREQSKHARGEDGRPLRGRDARTGGSGDARVELRSASVRVVGSG